MKQIFCLLPVFLLGYLSVTCSRADTLIDILSGVALTGPNLTGDFANDVGTSGGSNTMGTSGAYSYDSAHNTITPFSDETPTGGTGANQGALLSGSGQMVKTNSGDKGYLDLGTDWSSLLITETFTSYLAQTNSAFGPGGPLFASAYWTNDVTPGTANYLQDIGVADLNFGEVGTFSSGTTHTWFLTGNYASSAGGGITPEGEYLVYTFGTFNTATTSTRMDGLALVGQIAATPEPSCMALLLVGGGLGFLTLKHRGKYSPKGR